MRPRRRSTPYLLVAPALALFTFESSARSAATAVFSFFDWNGFGPFEAVGIANYSGRPATRSSGLPSSTLPSTSPSRSFWSCSSGCSWPG